MTVDGSKDKIILYHGSKGGIIGDITPSSRYSCDFGRGFYLGTNRLQAETLICNDDKPILYEIELDLKNLRVLKIDNQRDWYLTVAYSRNRLEDYNKEEVYKYYSKFLDDYDVVIGSIADDSIYKSLDSFFDLSITEKTLISCLNTIDLGTQYVCKTERACKNLKIISKKSFSKEEIAKLKKTRIEKVDLAKIKTEEIRKFSIREKGIFFDEIIADFNKNNLSINIKREKKKDKGGAEI